MASSIINYVVMTGKREEITPLHIPDNMHHEILRWMHGLPQTIGHYLRGASYYDTVINSGLAFGLRVTWVFEDSYDDILSERFIQFHPGLKVFVVAVSSDSEIKAVNSAFGSIANDGDSVVFSLYRGIRSELPTAFSRDELINLIDAYVLVRFPALYEKKCSPHPICSTFDNGMLFNPTVPNTELLHSAVGNFQFDVRQYSAWEKSAESSEATKNRNSYERQNQLVNQLKNFDRLENEFLHSHKDISWMEDQFRAPLVLSLPYNSKNVLEVLEAKVSPEFRDIQKSVKMAMSAGQTSNYTHLPQNDAGIKIEYVAGAITAISLPRSRYLDIIGGLHATFRFSPLMRLPAVGSNFNKLLSRVAPVAFNRLMMPCKKQSLIKTIGEIGEEMAKKELSAESRDFILNSRRQVVAITDLPIEWMVLDGVPLGFSHDVCRIPEVPYAIGMQHYVANCNRCFFIPRNILSKTLVVFGCSDTGFLPFQKNIEHQSNVLGYRTTRPANVKELSETIRDFKPLLLIFDTHGDFDRKSHESYIHIGKDKLYPELVETFHITAPLIFLSACNTAPVYNLTKTIANAFVAEGALAVTAAYMPLSITEASITYMRLLRLLHEASGNCIHKNWLSFICYVLRTSALYEPFFDMMGDDDVSMESLRLQAELAKSSVSIENRHALYEKMKRGVSVDGKRFSFERHVPNYLMYSTIGRADLIDFEPVRNFFRPSTC